jgi:hypothetical protein
MGSHPTEPSSALGWLTAVAALLTGVSMLLSSRPGMIIGAASIAVIVLLARTRLMSACGLGLTVIIMLIGGSAAGGVGYVALVDDDKTEQPNVVAPLPPPIGKPNRKPKPKPKPTPKPEPSPTPKREWADECPWEPGAGAPEYAREPMKKLYLGPRLSSVDPPPGAGEGGCTGLTTTYPGFAFTEGRDEGGTLKSVAVVSKSYGPAIFIAPAAKPVRALINRYKNIGGWLRTPAGHGDYYGVKSPYGTCILMRPAPVRDDGSGRTQGYAVLLPAAASLWMDAMRKHGSWLWAIPRDTVHGKLRIKLVSNLQTNKLVDTIFVNLATGEARLAGEPWSGSTYGRDLSQSEVQSFAPLVPGAESR